MKTVYENIRSSFTSEISGEVFLYDSSCEFAPIDATNQFNVIGDSSEDGDTLDDFSTSISSFPEVDITVKAEKRQKIAPLADSQFVGLVPDDDISSNNLNSLRWRVEDRASSASSPYVEEDDDIDTLPIDDGPLPHPAYSLTESMIAQKMSQLSMKDREEIYFDIHGVSDVINEDAESGFAEKKLKQMQHEILKINPNERKAYDKAFSLNAGYVEDPDFRLRFLRAERFDVKLAAARYARHFQTKLDLFGPEKLGRDIVQDDLGEEALDNLYSGLNQVLPRRDNAGRLVWLWIAAPKEQTYSKKALLRRIFYNNMMISEDVETQKKGSVGIIYTLKQQQTKRGDQGRSRIQGYSGITKSMPMPIVSIHFCYDNYAWLPVLSVAQMSVHLFVRLRVRAHLGSHADCMYKLRTFGIPVETIPIDEKGNFTAEKHKHFLENRRRQEREWAQNQATKAEISDSKRLQTTAPSSCDVLLGRGSGYFNHVGNLRYRSMIEELKDKYDKSSIEGKQKMTEDVVKTIHELRGRFLKNNNGVWVEVDDKTARQKVGHSFRALRCAPSQKAKNSNTKDTRDKPGLSMKRIRNEVAES